jgi:hypothetical protein
MMWPGSWTEVGRKEVFCSAAVAVLTGAYKGLVCEMGKSLSGARFLFRPLRTGSQRYCKPTRPYTEHLPVATTTRKSYNFCLSSQAYLKTHIAQYTNFDPDSRTIYSTKRRDCGYHRCFPCLSNPPITT